MFKNALVSVSDKTGLAEFLKPFADQGMRIVSSGGTAKFLTEKGFDVVKVSEQTGFPEVMGGRVKTLHPNIHMPLLQRSDVPEDQEVLKEYGLEPFDLVVVNLYPFREALQKDLSKDEMIEFIDIGGPTLLRASAKNFKSASVVVDPSDYDWVAQKKELTLEDRQKLAAKVFMHVSDYDLYIANFLGMREFQGPNLNKELRYGENPQQKGWWLKDQASGLHQAKILQGKELSYNNLLDLDAALNALFLFDDPTVISVKHNNPCGVATADNISSALTASLKADPVSVFGGIIALNQEIDLSCAEQLTTMFLECIVAPSISDEAKAKLAEKKNLRVLIWEDMMKFNPGQNNPVRSIMGGHLEQTPDTVTTTREDWKLVTGELSEEDWQALTFSWKVCSCLKSNAISVTNKNQTLGLGMGQVNRVDAVEQAFGRAQKFHPDIKDYYLASDAFFPFPDSIELAHQFGVKAIIQPGGSVKDEAVIAKAKELNIPMVFTGKRHFRH